LLAVAKEFKHLWIGLPGSKTIHAGVAHKMVDAPSAIERRLNECLLIKICAGLFAAITAQHAHTMRALVRYSPGHWQGLHADRTCVNWHADVT
jgi:hypothetical protein